MKTILFVPGFQEDMTSRDLELKKWPDITYREKAIRDQPHMKVKIAVGAKHDVASDAYITAIKQGIL